MDELALFILVIVLAILLAAAVLPIVALVISIRTKNKLTKQLAALGANPTTSTDNRSLLATIHELQARVAQLEAAVRLPREQRPIEHTPIPRSSSHLKFNQDQ